ncbi:hypothetical protein IMSAGC018_00758 [Lachnospiraceae bacterium]|nr:hypothetical protein IMSAGC018_00758 [Lachnospiraceae bacterium]
MEDESYLRKSFLYAVLKVYIGNEERQHYWVLSFFEFIDCYLMADWREVEREMDVESYFADALELGDAYWELSLVEDEEKKESIREYIKHLPYIKNIRRQRRFR